MFGGRVFALKNLRMVGGNKQNSPESPICPSASVTVPGGKASSGWRRLQNGAWEEDGWG